MKDDVIVFFASIGAMILIAGGVEVLKDLVPPQGPEFEEEHY